MNKPDDGQVSVQFTLPDAAATQAFGCALATVLRAGDVVLLTGALGAGKTTLTQGIGAGLQVRGQVASPTFIVAREHPSLVGGPALVHVDAYRIGSMDEIDALDLDTSLDESVTVVEWGEGLAEVLAADRLEITLDRPRGTGDRAVAGGRSEAADRAEAGTGPMGDVPGAGQNDEPGDEPRRVTIRAVGHRWADIDLSVIMPGGD